MGFDVIYHPFPINSQYLKTWEADSTVLGKQSVQDNKLRSIDFTCNSKEHFFSDYHIKKPGKGQLSSCFHFIAIWAKNNMTWILFCEFNRRTKGKWDTTGGGVRAKLKGASFMFNLKRFRGKSAMHYLKISDQIILWYTNQDIQWEYCKGLTPRSICWSPFQVNFIYNAQFRTQRASKFSIQVAATCSFLALFFFVFRFFFAFVALFASAFLAFPAFSPTPDFSSSPSSLTSKTAKRHFVGMPFRDAIS